jgi:hypothetical protein
MERLHEALATEMRKILEDGVYETNKDTGEIVKVTPGAAYLNAIRQFLKDNGIDARDDKAGSAFTQFANKALPFLAQVEDEDATVN